MSVITPITNSFTLGELSPLMLGRSDIDGYRNGLSSLENMFPDSRGPAISRKGSKFVGGYTGSEGRIVALSVSDDFFYTAVFTTLKLTVTSATGRSPADVVSAFPRFLHGEEGWSSDTAGNGSVVFQPSLCTLTISDKNGQKAEVFQEVTGLSTATDYDIVWALAGPTTGKVRVGSAQGLGDLFEDDTFSLSAPGESFNTGANTSVWISIILDTDITKANQEIEISTFGVKSVAGAPLEYVTPYLGSEVEALQAVQAPLGDAVYILHPSHQPYKLLYDKANDVMSWSIVTFTLPPPEWSNQSYPVTGTFYQGRLWLGGPPNNDTTFWASRSGVLEDFTLGANADDAMQFTLNSFGAIRWMSGFKSLMLGTIYAEHIITSEGPFIAPQDVDVAQQSSYGSAAIQPVQVGDQIFYVSADRRKLRAMQYEWQADNWLSKDLTFNSEHITEAEIRHIAWHQNPKNLLHCVLRDGTLASMTYERASDSYGWSRVAMQGSIVDVAVAPIQGTDMIHGLVYHGDDRMYLETQAQIPSYYNMDSWILKQVSLGDTIISGLDHLEGYTVQIQINGALYPDQEVIGGEISIPDNVIGNAVVGLQFNCKMRTLPLVVETQNGSNAMYEKRWNKIYLRVLNSAKPIINGSRPATRHPATLMDTAEPVQSEDIEIIDLGYDRLAIITVEQNLPLDLTVLGLFGKLATSIT